MMKTFVSPGRSALLAAALAFLVQPDALAGKVRTWTVRTAQEFAEGKLDGVVIGADHMLRMGRRLRRHAVDDIAVWAVHPDGEGGVYLGTGTKGELHRLRGGEITKLAETGQLAITAICMAPGGGVLLGTIPDGIIFRYHDGELTEFARLEAKYVWDLLYAADGSVYAATGPEGVLYRIAGGEAEVWLDTKEQNLLSLATAGGDIYAGSGEKGLLFRVPDRGVGTVVHHFAENELRRIVSDGEVLYVAANAAKDKGGEGPPAEGAQQAAKPLPSRQPMNCTVYRIAQNGSVEALFGSKGEYIWSLAIMADGSLLAGTGDNGRVYRITVADRSREVFVEGGGTDVLLDLEEGQALALAVEFGRLRFIGTGNGASVHEVDSAAQGEGRYESKVLDAQFISTWGRVETHATGRTRVFTRSGATAEPDETWDAWRPLTAETMRAASPRSRYLQFAVELAERAARLDRITIAYQPDNQRPRIAGVALQTPKNSGPQQAQAAPPAQRMIGWQASDPDGDPLVFRLFYRLEDDGEDAFVPITTEPVTGDSFVWNTFGLPDGRYVVRLIASDELVNPAGSELRTARDTEPILIDQTAPVFSGLRVEGRAITGTVEDAASRITALAYSLNGGRFVQVAPEGGILDGRRARFRIALPDDLAPGRHAAAVQAVDEAGNIRTERMTFRIE